jgi:hypothetical protein
LEGLFDVVVSREREREREAILDRRVVAEDEEMSRMMTWRKARLLRRRCLLHRQL